VGIEADLVVHNVGQLVTGEPAQGMGPLGVLEHAAVASLQGQVVWVGPSARWPWRVELRAEARVVDAGGACALPGFVDAHAALIWEGSRAEEHAARISGRPYSGGGLMRSVRDTRIADEEDLVASGQRRLNSFLRHGITSAELRSGYGLSLAAEEKLIRVAERLAASSTQRLVITFYGGHVPPEDCPREEYLNQVRSEMLPRFKGRADFCQVWCDPGAFDPGECRSILAAAHTEGFQLKVSAAQLAPGEGPQVAVEMGAASVAHLNYLRDTDARTLAESSTVCVICPASTTNLKMASEGAARALAAAGCELALATDYNPTTSCSENMCLIIGLACQELGLSVEEALRAATLGGARALRLQRWCGSIRQGKRCDLLLLDAESYLEIPYRLGVNLVQTAICNGVLPDER